MPTTPVAIVLTIAGSDSGGGAGIQADLKTFAAHGVYGLTAVTAVTAQDTVGVHAVHRVPASIVARQIEVSVRDFGVGAAKTGMLGDGETIETVAAALEALSIEPVVVDPVMVATSGDRLLVDEALDTLKTTLLPRATVTTPNRFEAEQLTGRTITSLADAREAARAIHDLGPGAVVITGGHLPGPDVTDLLFDGENDIELRAPRLDVAAGHGTGCTFSAALAARLARGDTVAEATQRAQVYVGRCLRHAWTIGHGNGPLHHVCPE